jgi:hypothetical protein
MGDANGSLFLCKLIQKSREGYFASVLSRCLGPVIAIAKFHSHGLLRRLSSQSQRPRMSPVSKVMMQ